MMTLSEHIKQKRKKNGLSQVELAERAGVGLRFVREHPRVARSDGIQRPQAAGASGQLGPAGLSADRYAPRHR